MKGVIFNLLESVVSEELGEAAWDRSLADAGVDGAYTSLGSYPHEELGRLALALSGPLGLEPDEVVRWFGRHALGRLAALYPQFFDGHDATGPFLLTLNDIIHPEVRKLYPGADVPVFDYRLVTPERVLMGYRSRRGLCAFGEGLIEGAAEHYGQTVAVSQPTCSKRGDSECEFDVVFEG